MKTKYLVLIGLLLVLAVLVSGCATGLTASSWPSVTADSQNAYIAGGPFVYAVNLQTGVEAWRFPAKASAATPFYARPVLTPDGQLIVGGFDHKLYSLNPQSGVENWHFDQARDRWIGGALATADGIFAPNADYNLYALTSTGTAKWVTPFKADQAIWGTPVTDGTNIYFGTLGRKVYAVNAQSGALAWVQDVDGAILGSPVLGENDRLYVGTYGGVLVTINVRNGEIINQETASTWIWSGPAQDGTYVYAGDANGMFYAFPLSDTGQPWTVQLSGTIIGSPLVTGDQIAVGTEAGNVYYLSKNGEILQTISVSGKVHATPAAAGSLVLVAPSGGDNLLIALDKNGTTKWSFKPAK